MTKTVAWLAAALCLAGCSKEKSKAVQAYDVFAEALARNHLPKAHELAPGAEFVVAASPAGEAEAQDGKVVHQPLYDKGIVGDVWWVRSKVESEKKEAGLTHLVVVTDVCRNPSDANGCNRPDTYRHRVRLRQEGEAWQVVAFTEALVSAAR